MSTSDPEREDFDLLAAGLRLDGSDVRTSLEVLASKLEQALPGRTRVERRGGGLLRRGEQRVRELHVELGGSRYLLQAPSEQVECFREKEVGGISIKRETLDPGTWVKALTTELRAESERSEEAREALARLLA